MSNKNKRVAAILIDFKGRIHLREPRNKRQFVLDEVQLMVGGYIDEGGKSLNCLELSVDNFCLKKPVVYVNRDAKLIPLPPNETGQTILKKAGMNDLPLGNVVIIDQKYKP